MKAVTVTALLTVLKRHGLEQVKDAYEITEEMVAEAAAIDEARGNRISPDEWEEPSK
jgi:hypothetical protein